MKQKTRTSNEIGKDRKPAASRPASALGQSEQKQRLGQRANAKNTVQQKAQQRQRQSLVKGRGKDGKRANQTPKKLSRTARLQAINAEQEQASRELAQLADLEKEQAKELSSLRDRLGSLESEKHALVSALKQALMMEGLQKRPSLAAQPSMSAGFDLQTAIPAGQHAGNRMLPPSDITSPTSAAQQQGADAAGPFTSPGVAPHLGNGSLRGSKRPRHSNATEDPDEGEILDDSHPLLPSFAPSGGILLPPGGMSGGLNHSGSNHCGGGSASEASEHGPPAGSPSYSALGSARSLQPGQLQSPGQGHLPHRPWGAGPLSGPQQTHNVHSSGLQPPHSHFKPPPAPPPGPAPSSAPPHAIPINPLHGSLMSPRYGSSPVQGDGRGGAFAGTHGGMAYRPPQSQGPGSAGAGGRHSAPGQPGYPTHVQGQWHWRPAPQGRGMEKEGPQGHQPYQPYHSGGRAGAGRGGYFGSRGHH